MARLFAYAWRSGVIEFGAKVPPTALKMDHGGAAAVRRRVNALARHAYDGKTLLVPGIPEAETDDQALEAARAFARLMDTRRRRPRLPLFAPNGVAS